MYPRSQPLSPNSWQDLSWQKVVGEKNRKKDLLDQAEDPSSPVYCISEWLTREHTKQHVYIPCIWKGSGDWVASLARSVALWPSWKQWWSLGMTGTFCPTLLTPDSSSIGYSIGFPKTPLRFHENSETVCLSVYLCGFRGNYFFSFSFLFPIEYIWMSRQDREKFLNGPIFRWYIIITIIRLWALHHHQ